MITPKDFAGLYSTIATRFQAMNNIALTGKCYHYVSDLPIEAVKEICEDFFDNARHAPLPGDFKKSAKDWKKNFYMKNGFWYGNTTDITPAYKKIDCEYCNDGGIVRMVSLSGDHEKLIRCSCVAGEQNVIKIPVWSNDLRNAFQRESCPLEWFKPDIESNDPDAKIYRKIWDKLKVWEGRISEAEKHWASLGYKENK